MYLTLMQLYMQDKNKAATFCFVAFHCHTHDKTLIEIHCKHLPRHVSTE